MKEMLITDIIEIKTSQKERNKNQHIISLWVTLDKPYFVNPDYAKNNESTQEIFVVAAYNSETKTIQSKRQGFIYQLSNQAFSKIESFLKKRDINLIFDKEIDLNKCNEYQNHDHRPVFFNLPKIKEQIEIKEAILENENSNSIEKTISLLNELDFIEIDLPDEYLNGRIFFNNNSLSNNLMSIEEIIFKNFINLSGIYNRFTHIDQANKKLMIEKSTIRMIADEITKSEDLDSNEFLVYLDDSRTFRSNKPDLLKEFCDTESNLDAIFSFLKYSDNTLLLIEKMNDNQFVIKGHYDNECNTITNGCLFINDEFTNKILSNIKENL